MTLGCVCIFPDFAQTLSQRLQRPSLSQCRAWASQEHSISYLEASDTWLHLSWGNHFLPQQWSAWDSLLMLGLSRVEEIPQRHRLLWGGLAQAHPAALG